MNLPKPILDKLSELERIIEENPHYIPIPVAAKFLAVNAEGLRNSIETGRCTFGFGWQKYGRGNKAFKIPTATFYFWYLNTSGCRPIAANDERWA